MKAKPGRMSAKTEKPKVAVRLNVDEAHAAWTELYNECLAAIKKHGLLIPGRDGALVKNPAFGMATQALLALQRLDRQVPPKSKTEQLREEIENV